MDDYSTLGRVVCDLQAVEGARNGSWWWGHSKFDAVVDVHPCLAVCADADAADRDVEDFGRYSVDRFHPVANGSVRQSRGRG